MTFTALVKFIPPIFLQYNGSWEFFPAKFPYTQHVHYRILEYVDLYHFQTFVLTNCILINACAGGIIMVVVLCMYLSVTKLSATYLESKVWCYEVPCVDFAQNALFASFGIIC